MPPVPEWVSALVGAVLGGAVSWGAFRVTVQYEREHRKTIEAELIKHEERIREMEIRLGHAHKE